MLAVNSIFLLALCKETAESFHWNFNELQWEHCCLMDFVQWVEAFPLTIQLFMGLACFANFHYHFTSAFFECWCGCSWSKLTLWLCSKPGSKFSELQRDLGTPLHLWWCNGVRKSAIELTSGVQAQKFLPTSVRSYILPITLATHINPDNFCLLNTLSGNQERKMMFFFITDPVLVLVGCSGKSRLPLFWLDTWANFSCQCCIKRFLHF